MIPSYVYCEAPGCEQKHYLSLNKDIQGKWSIGYMEFETHTAIYGENGFNSIEEATDWVEQELC